MALKNPQMAEDLEGIFAMQKHQENSSWLEMFDVETLIRGLQIKSLFLKAKGYRCIVEESPSFETPDRYVMFLVQNKNEDTFHFRIRARAKVI